MKTKITFIALLVSIFGLTLSAATVTCVATGDWANAATWSVAPTAADSVYIPATFTVTVSTDAGMINRLTVSGKLIIATGGILTVDQTAAFNSGTVNNVGSIVTIAGGEIENNGAFTVKNSVAVYSSTVVKFAENAEFDNKLNNKGTFTLDNTVGAYASTVGRGIGLSQIAPGRTSTFVMGGTMNFNIKAGCCLIESNDGGNLTIDGTATIGSADSYKDFRFIKILNGGNVTIAPTAKITLYSGFTNASNGVINVQTATTVAPGANFTNNGTLLVYGGPGTTGYGLYFNGQAASAINTVTNNHYLTFIGTFPKGAFYVGGNATAINTLNNSAAAILSFSNADPLLFVMKSATATTPLSVVNEGVINVSTVDHLLSAATIFSGAGSINYSVQATGVKSIKDFSGKVSAFGQTIEVSLAANESAQLVLTDITGRTIQTATIQGEKNILTTNNLKGIYIVRLLMAKGSYSQKVSLN